MGKGKHTGLHPLELVTVMIDDYAMKRMSDFINWY